jgi:hypothetical protein
MLSCDYGEGRGIRAWVVYGDGTWENGWRSTSLVLWRCVHIHIYIHIHLHRHTHIHTYLYTYTYTCMYTHIYTYTSTHIHTHIYIHPVRTVSLRGGEDSTSGSTHTYTHPFTHTHMHTCMHSHREPEGAEDAVLESAGQLLGGNVAALLLLWFVCLFECVCVCVCVCVS